MTRAHDIDGDMPTTVMERPTRMEKSIRVSNPDAVALVLIGVAIILACATWFQVAGIIGEYLTDAVRYVIGAGAYVLPVALIAVAIALMMDLSGRPDILSHAPWAAPPSSWCACSASSTFLLGSRS